MRRSLLCLLSLSVALVRGAASAGSSPSLADRAYRSALDYSDYESTPSTSHTYMSRAQCEELCEVPCTQTFVNMEQLSRLPLTMYYCAKIRPPKAAPFLSTLKGNGFYMALFVCGILVVGVIVLVTLCYCCSYCCRHSSGESSSSRGSSKQALAHHEDGEFKEFLTGNGLSNGIEHEIGAVKREREFSRRPRGTPHVV